MSRGRYPRRINLSGVDKEALAPYLLFWDPAELHFTPDKFPMLDSPSLFELESPLSLDIGCGTGEFLCELAVRKPDEMFLGLDNAFKPVLRAGMQALERKLANIRFLRADIRQALIRMSDASFHRVYLQFPVPGPAGKGRRPRFFDENFVIEIKRILEVDGVLSVITDNEGGFSEMQALFEGAEGFRLLDEQEYQLELDEALSSHNYQVWIGRGHLPYRFEVQKTAPAIVAASDV